jgi:two-component system, NarL family, sensor kinase
MWVLAKHVLGRPSRVQLESLLLERTGALQKLSQRLLKLQDDERRRVARDLHDTVGQTLAALKMGLAALENRLQNTHSTNTRSTTDMLTELVVLTDQAIKEIRTTSYLLHPPLLDEVGFVAAARWYVEGFGQRSGIKASTNFATTAERLPIAIETALFRILQEGLSNVHRYSGSSEVSVVFQVQKEAVILQISDRGRGIPEELLQRLGEGSVELGVGLAGMRERLDEFSGALEINSSGSGTTLRAIVPLTAMTPPITAASLTNSDKTARCRNSGPIPLPVATTVPARSAYL